MDNINEYIEAYSILENQLENFTINENQFIRKCKELKKAFNIK